MSVEQNKEIVRRYSEEFWGRGDEAVGDEVFADDIVDHSPAIPEQPPGREGEKRALAIFRGAFPDLRVTTEDIIAEGDKAVLRWTARGTHRGELSGLPATGKQATLKGIDILRLAEGRIVERWAEYDNLGLLQQLGAVPAPGAEAQRLTT
jgi:steroid delta-isomerase-like uncharacterized protein